MSSEKETSSTLSESLWSAEREGYKQLLVTAHAYQPQRETFCPASKDRLSVVPQVNEVIYEQVYKPLLVEGKTLPRDLVFSFYPGLRDWMRSSHPDEYGRVVEKINALPNKEYQVLGDPYLHDILPLLPIEDQDLLVKIGKKAFEDDLGFEPKGFWAPETAISAETLDVLLDNGYEFVVLRDSQLKETDSNPIKVRTPSNREINVIHFNSGLSGSLSFDSEVSANADDFLNRLSGINLNTVSIASDMELYGHHKPDRDKFLLYLEKEGILERHGFVPFDVKRVLEADDREEGVTEVWDRSSWSCEHGLGRWTGECGCDNPSHEASSDKRYFFQTLTKFGLQINLKLDQVDSDWRERFTEFFLSERELMFDSAKKENRPIVADNLYWAKYCELVGRVSCGWFFGGKNSPEREIPRRMILEIDKLIPDINEQTVFDQAA